MALVANGATLHADGYEYGVEDAEGLVSMYGTYGIMVSRAKRNGGKMMFRAVYRTDWWQATDTEV